MKGIALESLKPVCRKAAADSAVLLRNYNDLLPLKDNDKVALSNINGQIIAGEVIKNLTK